MKRQLLIIIFLAFTIKNFAITNQFVNEKKIVKKILAEKVSTAILLDGILNEEQWKKKPISDFIQRDPNEGSPATEKTNVWIAYDDLNVYVAAKLYDSRVDSVTNNLARRDDRIPSDWLVVYFDSYNDKKNAYYFAVNPAGSIYDGMYFNDSWNDDSWDGVWEWKTSIDKEGWNVEIKIPFSQFRFNEAESMVWGINLARQIKRKEEVSYLSMVPKNESGFVSKFATLEGLTGIKPKQRFEIMPYLVQKASYLIHDKSDPFYKQNQYRTALGADIKIGIGSGLNLDATINPDFGQVEVDPAVVNLSAFETFYQEKRPFFIEGANLFMFGVGGINNNWGFNFGWPEFFYSRRIGRHPQGEVSDNEFANIPNETRILGAAKLTGKLDEKTSIAVLSALTEKTYATIYNNSEQVDEVVEPLTHYSIFRGRHEFDNGKKALGFAFSSVNRNLQTDDLTNRLSKNAFAYGIDGWTNIDSAANYVLAAAFAGTYTHGSEEYLIRLQQKPYRYFQRPDATFARLDSNLTSLSGWYGRVMLNKQSGNFYLNAALGAISPGFENNDLGYQWMADRINGHLVMGYRWYDPDPLFRRKNIYVSHARSVNFDGNIISNFLWSSSYFQFHNYWTLSFGYVKGFDFYTNSKTRGGPLYKYPGEYQISLDASTDSRKKIYFYLYTYYTENKLDDFDFTTSFEAVYSPYTQLNISIGPQYTKSLNNSQWIDNIEDPSAINTYGFRYVFGELKQDMISANIRVNWTFTPKLSLQLFMQPLLAVGKYTKFQEFVTPKGNEMSLYGENGSVISYNNEDNTYTIDPDGSGAGKEFTIDNPDFNFKSLKANVVLRWEALPGSVFYFVWTHNRQNLDDPGRFSLKRDFSNLWSSESDNVFLIKFSYWLDV